MRCFSFTASREWCFRYAFTNAGLRSATTDLGDGTIVHCWVPKTPDPAKPSLLLIHGFGANSKWQWSDYLRPLIAAFNVYVPDLLFFGESFTTQPERTESFQASCLVRAMEVLGVHRMSLVGISYGGFVGYRMAEAFPERVEKVVLCCAGVCMDETDLREGFLATDDVDEAANVLLPQKPELLRELMRLSFVKPPPALPTCFLADYIEVMCKEYALEKKELIHALVKDRKHSDLPKITQPTLIIWGEQDRIFPLELGHRLNRHLEGNSQLVIIKDAGHAVNLEKQKEVFKHLKAFLIDSLQNDYENQKATRSQCAPNVAGLWRRMKEQKGDLVSKLPLMSGKKS